jgi:phosphatidylinositol alpha-1,6-mannosyltransferase
VTRLMVVTPVFPPATGGIERLTHAIVTRWADSDVLVCTLDEPGAAGYDAAAPQRIARTRNEPRGGRRSIARLTALTAAQALSFRPDVVLSMHVRCAAAAQLARRISGARWVQYYHAKEVPTWPGAARRGRLADQGVAVSGYTAELVARVTGTQPVVIPPGVEPPGQPGATAKRPRPTILTVSRLSDAYKGHDVMLRALPDVVRRGPDVEWLVVGEGERREQLGREASRLGLDDRVRFLGPVGDQELRDLMAGSHLFALPSRTADDGRSGEGFGIVYVEAAAAGLPVVAGDRGGARDAVAHGRSGVLVDATSPRAVAGALGDLLTDEGARLELSRGAREWSERFHWSRVFPRIRDVLVGGA